MSATLLAWLLAWSGLAVLLAWRLPAAWQLPGVAACGASLLACLSPASLAWLTAATLLSWQVARRWPQRGAVIGVAVAAVAAAYLSGLWLGRHDTDPARGQLEAVLLPLGAAFYSLRLIHYLVETYKGSLRPHGLAELLAYQFLPSALPVGPVHRFDEFLRDARRRRWEPQRFSIGLERALLGLFKVVVVGNYLVGHKIEPALAEVVGRADWIGTYVAALLMWGRLYVLFSGCSDLAVGLAAMAGFTLRENFDRPYAARNIAQFWQRWHRSLSSWCRDYVFAPVLAWGRRPGLAVVASMLVLGGWHALSWHYLLWGLYHGLALAVFRRVEAITARWPAAPAWQVPLRTLASTVLTLHVVVLSFPVTTAVERWLAVEKTAGPPQGFLAPSGGLARSDRSGGAAKGAP